jgi:acyl-homoserine-lactone acylase
MAPRRPHGRRPPARPLLAVLASGVALALVAAACTSEDGDEPAGGDTSATTVAKGPGGYGALIRRTADGVPHVWAEDDAGVYFGQGWASAEDHPCDLVDQVIEVTSRRSATFGPGEDDANLTSDLGWAALGIAERAAADWPEVPEDVRVQIEGFAEGWSARVEQVGSDGLDDWCRGAGWVRPVTPLELYTYARSVMLLASGARLVPFIARAAPPGSPPVGQGEAALAGAGDDVAEIASNGWAIGSERSASGNAMLVGNPHFPWIGELRFSEVQLSTSDGLDVYGAQLLGLPGVGIGFTDGVAWTHTVSAGRRFTAYEVTLAPGDPTSYVVDGETRKMTSRDVTVDVLRDDGTIEAVTRTYWSTEHGPVLDFPGVGWSDTTTIAYRDANIDNTTFLSQYSAMDRARSLDDLRAAHEEFQGVPLFNTVAAGADGTAWYADTSATPNLSAEALAAYEQRLESDPLTKAAAEANAVLLDGSTSRDAWVDDPDAPWPGVLPWADLPMAERSDYVMNANDSFWVPHHEATIEGDYSPLQGRQDTARSVRTLENLRVLADEGPEGASGEDGRFDLDELAGAALADGSYTEQQWRAGVVERCRALAAAGPVTAKAVADDSGAVVVPAAPVDIAPACGVLDGWDGRFDVDSRGAVLWREFLAQVRYDALWATPFDAEAPATTPAGLGPAVQDGVDQVGVALATALAVLGHAGLSPDVALGDAQFDGRVPDARRPVPGGLGSDGVTNVVSSGIGSSSTREEQPELPEPFSEPSTLTGAGYPIGYGTSFLMVVELSDDAPVARTLLTFGQVGDRDSELFVSGVEDFAAKRLKTVRFTAEDIEADPDLEVEAVEG